MYHVSAQGVDECMISVHFIIIIIIIIIIIGSIVLSTDPCIVSTGP